MIRPRIVKFTGEFNITVTPKSKNTVYIYNSKIKQDISYFKVNTSGYDNCDYINFPYRRGNDLVIKTLFTGNMYMSKRRLVTTTIKNYFKSGSLLGEFSEGVIFTNGDGFIINTINPNGPFIHIKNVHQIELEDYILASRAKNAELTLYSGGSDVVYDEKGNDKYNFTYKYRQNDNTSSGWDSVFDFSGNDKYIVYENSEGWVADYKGNDKYIANSIYGKITAYDFKGNDKYKADNGGQLDITDSTGNEIYELYSEESSTIYDYKGKDRYYIHNSEEKTIIDLKGDDKYYFTNARAKQAGGFADITDEKGKDYYKIISSCDIKIEDKSGKDKYVISDCSDLSNTNTEKYIEINDLGTSTDTYILNNILFSGFRGDFNIQDNGGAERYSLKNVRYFTINDKSGNDRYSAALGSEYLRINDDSGKDTYTFIAESNIDGEAVRNLTIVDSGTQSDKYNFKFVSNNDLYDDENYNTVTDNGGDDNYKLVNCDNISISDDSGNDTYNFSVTADDISGNYRIADNNGKDSYTIKGAYFKKTNNTVIANGITITDTGEDSDKYYLNRTFGATISDDGGKNKYTVKNSKNINITASGENKFTLYDIANLNIATTGDYKDKYNLSYVTGNVEIFDNGISNDTYNLKKSNAYIHDKGGSDKYIIDKLSARNAGGIRISDEGGTDKLIISNIRKKDIIFLTNYDTDGNYADDSCSLVIYDKKNKGYIYIEHFYADEDGDGIYDNDKFGDGKIESLKIRENTKKREITLKLPKAEYFSGLLKQHVSSWLANAQNNFTDVSDALKNGSDAQIQELVSIFEEYNSTSNYI